MAKRPPRTYSVRWHGFELVGAWELPWMPHPDGLGAHYAEDAAPPSHTQHGGVVPEVVAAPMASPGLGRVSAVDHQLALLREMISLVTHEAPDMRAIGERRMRELAEYLVNVRIDQRLRRRAIVKAAADARWRGRDVVLDMIAKLAKQRHHDRSYVEPRELWPELYALLEDAQLHPGEHEDRYVYEGGGIKYTTFVRHLQRYRAS